MVNVTISFDPAVAAEVDHARQLLDRLAPPPVEPTPDPDPEVLHQKVIALLRGYGRNRTEYIRLVAQASPGPAPYERLAAAVGSANAVHGTAAAIEQAWRAKGMPSPFIVTDEVRNATMDMRLADIVLFALHEIDEPDPLTASRY